MTARARWDDRIYLLAYEAATSGGSDAQVARSLGVSEKALRRWAAARPALREAIDRGRTRCGPRRSEFMEYAARRLPPGARELWDGLTSADAAVKASASDQARRGGKALRQSLFLHAYVAMEFNATRARVATGTNHSTLTAWLAKDRKFRAAFRSLHEAKKDFYEQALIDLVARREVPAVLFANRTLNRDRGYDSRVTVRVEGGISHSHSIDPSSLSIETRRRMLEEVEAARDRPLLEDRSGEGG